MAEAHSIATLRHNFKRKSHVFLMKDERGITVTFTIPPLFVIQRSIRRSIYRFRNTAINAFYPLGMTMYFLFAAFMLYEVFTNQRDSWWRSGPIATLVWNIMLYTPFFTRFSLYWQLLACVFWASLVSFLLIAVLQRYALRALLHYRGWLYLEPGQKSYVVNVWGLIVTLLKGRHPLTYSFKGALPRLPVPPLQQTCDNYLRSIRPLTTDEEYEKVRGDVEAFLANEAPRLQRYLLLKSYVSRNYISDWWEKYVYLRGRSPIMINSNYYALDQAFVWPNATQTARAANMAFELVTFARLLENETLPPLMIRNVVPVCMGQAFRMFSTSRVPGKESDEIVHYEAPESRHIAVFCNGCYYRMPVIERTSGRLLSAAEMEVQLELIKADAMMQKPTDTERGIPALTAVNRTVWAEAREELFSEGANSNSLDVIESALFILHLSDESPENWTEQGRALLHGSGSELWFDKSINLVVFANSKCGLNCEHAWGDATIIAHMWEWTCLTGERKGLGYDKGGHCVKSIDFDATAIPTPQRLSFDFDDEGDAVIAGAVTDAEKLVADLDLVVINFHEFGKSFMKKVRISPDAFLQLAFQVAYLRDVGKLPLTYEAAMTRLYRDGRTETVRPVTIESKAFLDAFMAGEPAEDVIELLRAAAAKHTLMNKDAMCGKGVDRHLFGLYVVSVGKNIDSPFLAEALGEKWMLSTSQQPQQTTDRWNPSKNPEDAKYIGPGGGFGPVADNGYGVSYMVAGEEHLFFHVSSKHSAAATNSERFAENISQALRDMRALFKVE